MFVKANKFLQINRERSDRDCKPGNKNEAFLN